MRTTVEFNPDVFDRRLATLTDPSFGIVEPLPVDGVFRFIRRPDVSDIATSPLAVITGPSQSGKDSIGDSLLAHNQGFSRVRTATTRRRRDWEADDAMIWMRPQRPGEDDETYANSLAAEYDLVECDPHYEHIYGVPRSSLDNIRPGTIPIVNADITGVATLRRNLPTHRILGILICPESGEVLRERITALGTNVFSRLVGAQVTLENADGVVDYVIINQHSNDPTAAIDLGRQRLESVLALEGMLGATAIQTEV